MSHKVFMTFGIFLTFFTNSLFGQVKITGPNEGKPNKNVVLTLEVQGNDMKIESFFNGEATSNNPKTPEGSILILRNLANQPIILINTENEGIFTFVIAANKDNATHTASHVVKIHNPKPTPPQPQPDNPNPMPNPTTPLATKLKEAYDRQPDSARLAQLVQIFEEVSKMNYRTYGDMETVLQNTANRYLQPNDLRPLRDTISSYLLEKLGDDARKMTVEKGKEVYGEIIKALRECSK